MVRLADIPEPPRARWAALECPTFETTPMVAGPPIAERRVAIVSTAGLQVRGDRPFTLGAVDYRLIPADAGPEDLVMCHVSPNYDRTGFQQDFNVAFPLQRLGELAADGVVGSVAAFHYSFMGATDPKNMEAAARHLAGPLRQDAVDAVLLVPV